MKLVVGLGNPGREYERTRHNLGFDVVAELSRRFAAPTPKLRYEASLTEILIQDCRVILAAPQSFMNLSGRSVRQIVDFFKIPLGDLLLICDDLALPTAKLRLRGSGTAGSPEGAAKHDRSTRLEPVRQTPNRHRPSTARLRHLRLCPGPVQ